MKIPSIFKTPKYQKFNITPRYYDPVKEEMEERTARIRRELNMGVEGEQVKEPSQYSSRIAGSFRQGRGRQKGSVLTMQLIIVILLVGGLAGYLYFGNMGLYIFLIVSSVLLYLKMKRII